jgi:hypothetical protein
MKATMDFHIRHTSSSNDEKERVTHHHQKSLETLQSPLNKYQRNKDRDSHKRHCIPMPVPNADKIPHVTVIIADSPDNEDVIIKVSSI